MQPAALRVNGTVSNLQAGRRTTTYGAGEIKTLLDRNGAMARFYKERTKLNKLLVDSKGDEMFQSKVVGVLLAKGACKQSAVEVPFLILQTYLDKLPKTNWTAQISLGLRP